MKNIGSYDRILVAFSGGKDSLACLLHLLDMGADPARIELHHHDVDGGAGAFMDWPVTPAYCRAVAGALGLPIYFSCKAGGFLREMERAQTPTARMIIQTPRGTISVGGNGPDGTRQRFPQVSADLRTRWCSAYLKIDVMDAVIRNQRRFMQGRTLVVTGERAEESANRSRYSTFEKHRTDTRESTRKARHVDHWRPVHAWTESQVWGIVQRWGIVPHPAYQIGWGRLSCLSCIFGSPHQWATIRAVFPRHFERIAVREERYGVTIQRRRSVRELADAGTPYAAALASPELVALASGEHWRGPIQIDPAAWTLPSGAYGENAGPT